MTFTQSPRFQPLLMVAVGVAVAVLLFIIGGVNMNARGGAKAIALCGVAGIALGLGLAQLAWPPPPPDDARDARNSFVRASLGQKVVYVASGLVGLIAIAVIEVVASGKY